MGFNALFENFDTQEDPLVVNCFSKFNSVCPPTTEFLCENVVRGSIEIYLKIEDCIFQCRNNYGMATKVTWLSILYGMLVTKWLQCNHQIHGFGI